MANHQQNSGKPERRGSLAVETFSQIAALILSWIGIFSGLVALFAKPPILWLFPVCIVSIAVAAVMYVISARFTRRDD